MSTWPVLDRKLGASDKKKEEEKIKRKEKREENSRAFDQFGIWLDHVKDDYDGNSFLLFLLVPEVLEMYIVF